MGLNVIATNTARDPGQAKKYLNRAYVNHLTKPNQQSKVNMFNSSRDFHEANKLGDKSCTQLEKGMDYEAVGLKLYRRFVMSVSYYPGINQAQEHHTISPLVSRGDHGIPIPPLPLAECKMLQPTATKRNKNVKVGGNVGGLLMDLAEDVSDDRTSSHTQEDTCTILPMPTEKDTCMIPPVTPGQDAAPMTSAYTEKEAGVTTPAPTVNGLSTKQPAPTGKEPSMTQEKPIDPKQKGS
jgi:hypothetical protein